MNITIEGHCDERGSTDYNLALGDQRASAVKNALTSAGISASRIKTISYGKEKPFCTEATKLAGSRTAAAISSIKSKDPGDAEKRPPVLVAWHGAFVCAEAGRRKGNYAR